MKKLLLFLLVCSVGLAQSVSVRRNLVANGTLLGAVAGAVIGNNSGHGNGAQGALIGAAAGAVLGSAAADAQGAPPARAYHRAPPHRGGDPVVGGAVLGGIAGGIMGNNSGHGNGARGALIGAAAGAVLGSSAHHQPAGRPYYGHSYGYGRTPYGRYPYRSYGYYGDGSYGTYYAQPRSYGSSGRGDATAAGMFFGGLAGAIIGNNSGHGNGLQGALVGAGVGALLGAASESHRDYYESPRDYAAPRTNYVQQMQARPQQVTVINNYYVTVAPRSGGYKMDAGAY